MLETRVLEESEAQEVAPVSSPPWLTRFLEFAILVLAVLLIFIVRQAWLEPAVVTSRSMEPALTVGDRFLVDHRRALSGKWKRGDIVLLQTSNGRWGEDVLVKRVIGLPGERVDIFRGRVYINRSLLPEEYLKERPIAEDDPTVFLKKNEYYVLGDNRNNSGDSRDYGPVKNSEIRGRVIRKIWPFEKLLRPDYQGFG